MRRMDEPSRPTGSTAPGERRLDRAPSERYRPTEIEPDAAPSAASPARGVAIAVVVAIIVGALITVLGGVLLITAGLVVVAAAGGWAVALAIRIGAGTTIPRQQRRALAIGLALGAVVIGQIGLWLFARNEGGVLALVDYLSQTFGILVPLQAAGAMVAAAWTMR